VVNDPADANDERGGLPGAGERGTDDLS